MANGVSSYRRVLCIIFFFLVFISCFSSETQRRKVRVGYGALIGFHEQTANGHRSGYGYEYLQRIAARAGWDCEYVGYGKSWLELTQMLERGEIDLLSCVSKTPDRMSKFAFSAKPSGLSFVNLTVKAGNSRFRPNDYASWGNMRIGMVRGNAINESFGDWAKTNGVQYTPVFFSSDIESAKAMQEERIDAIVSINFRRLNNEWLLERIHPESIFFAVNKNNTELLAELDRAHAKLGHENPLMHSQLILRYYYNGYSTLPGESDLLFIEKSKREGRVFKALLDPDRFPLVRFADGKLDGMQYNILQKIIDRTGLDVRIIPCTSHEEYLKLHATGNFDILLDSRYDFGQAEENGLLLCNSYLSTPVSILFRKDSTSSFGKIAFLAGSNLSDLMRMRGFDLSEVIYFPSIDAIAEAVKNGVVDKAYLYTRTCNELIRMDSSFSLASELVPGVRMEYAVAISKNAPYELFSIFNRTTNALSEAEIEDSISGYVCNQLPKLTIAGLLRMHPVEAVVFLLLLMMLLIFFLLYVLMARRKIYRNSQILERLPLLFFVADRNNNILLANASCLSNKVLKNVSDIDSPDIKKIVEKTLASAFNDGNSKADYDYGLEKHSAVASRLPASIFGRDAVVWIAQDTTELHNARSKAVDYANRMRLNIQSIGDAVIVTDSEGLITMMNPVAEKLCGFTQAEALGRVHEEVFNIVNYETDAPVCSPARAVLSTGKTMELARHTDLIAKDGSRRHIADSAAPVPGADGSISGVILVFRDVTEESDRRDRLNRVITLMELGSEMTDSAAFEYDFHADELTGSKLLDRLWPQVNGRPVDRRKWILRKDLRIFNNAFRSLRKGENEFVEFDFRSLYQGNMRFYRIKACMDKTESKSPRIVGVLRDVTAMNAALRMEQARSKALEVFFTSSDIRSAVSSMLKILNDYTGSVYCCVLKRQNSETLDMELFSEYRASHFPAIWEKHEKIHFDADWSGQQKLLKRGGAVQCPDLESESELSDCSIVKRLYNEFGIKALFLIGIYHENELWGEFGIAFEAPQRQYDKKHEDFLFSFAHFIEVMLSRKKIESRLRDSVTSLEFASDLTHSAAFVFDIKHDRLTGSKLLKRFWPHRNGVRVPSSEWVHPDDYKEWESMFKLLCSDGNNFGRHEVPSIEFRSDWFGMRRYYRIRGSMDVADPETPRVVGVISEVTENREKLLNEQHLKRCLEILFNSSPHVDSLREMLKVIAEYMEASRCEIIHMNFTNHTADAVCEYYTPESGPLLMNRMDLCFEPDWESIKLLVRGESVLLDDLDDERQLDMFPFMRVLRRERDWKSMFMTGIYLDGALWGEIEIGYEKKKSRPFSISQLSFLRSAAHIVELLLIREHADQRLQHALLEAQDAAKAKSYFLATMSHEIRTPLNAVIGFAELLKDRSVSPEQQQEYLGDIATAGNALLSLINDVLDLSKLESGQMKFVRESTDFKELVDEIETIFKAKLFEKKLSWLMDIKPIPILMTDKLRLRQILFNLIGNAIKFTESGSITVSAEFVRETSSSGTLCFSVIDTGCGVPASDQTKIFQPFVQSDLQRGTRVSNNGTGLGLAIIQRMLERMNGKITLSSELGKGSTFTVSIREVPFNEIAESEERDVEGVVVETELDTSLRILVVDDVPMNLKVILAMCRKLGLSHVETAGNAEMALTKLEQHPFDVVLTDMWMPSMNGAELAVKIRKNKAFDSILIFAVTADIEAQSTFKLDYFSGVIMKPVTLEKLVKIVKLAKLAKLAKCSQNARKMLAKCSQNARARGAAQLFDD